MVWKLVSNTVAVVQQFVSHPKGGKASLFVFLLGPLGVGKERGWGPAESNCQIRSETAGHHFDSRYPRLFDPISASDQMKYLVFSLSKLALNLFFFLFVCARWVGQTLTFWIPGSPRRCFLSPCWAGLNRYRVSSSCASSRMTSLRLSAGSFCRLRIFSASTQTPSWRRAVTSSSSGWRGWSCWVRSWRASCLLNRYLGNEWLPSDLHLFCTIKA